MLDNLSTSGFYLRLDQQVEHSENLLVISQISQAVIVLRGNILRVEQQKDSAYGAAIIIVQYRILSLIESGK